MVSLQLLAQILRVFHLNFFAESSSIISAMSAVAFVQKTGPLKSFGVEVRQIAAVVDMGMRKNDRIEIFGIAMELLVLGPRFRRAGPERIRSPAEFCDRMFQSGVDCR